MEVALGIFVVTPVVIGLGFAPSIVVSIFSRVICAHVARGPQGAARQAEINIVMFVLGKILATNHQQCSHYKQINVFPHDNNVLNLSLKTHQKKSAFLNMSAPPNPNEFQASDREKVRKKVEIQGKRNSIYLPSFRKQKIK